MPHSSPWYAFSLTVTCNKPDLSNYKCVPGGLWLKNNDKGQKRLWIPRQLNSKFMYNIGDWLHLLPNPYSQAKRTKVVSSSTRSKPWG